MSYMCTCLCTEVLIDYCAIVSVDKYSHWAVGKLSCILYLDSCVYCFHTQVIINDVHIRYEDSEADPSRPFSVGVVIDNISAQSTDENWVHNTMCVCMRA